MLLRLAYLTVTNTLTVLRLLPMSDRDKDSEILALRHQIAVLERQLGKEKVRFTASDRAFLAALLHGSNSRRLQPAEARAAAPLPGAPSRPPVPRRRNPYRRRLKDGHGEGACAGSGAAAGGSEQVFELVARGDAEFREDLAQVVFDGAGADAAAAAIDTLAPA